jgi:outer membrane immunogenic protein
VKKILLTTTGLIALGMAPAIAADLPARAYTKAPAAAIAINNWTGFYLGAMGGYASENSDGLGSISGGFAGGTAGYNWQLGNVGYAFDQVLIYGTAGYAWADNRLTLSALNVSVSDSQILSGWTAGAGVEVMFAPKWSVKGEYLYRSFEGQTYFSAAVPGGFATPTMNLHSFQVGVNYHF